ncbi:MAG: bifunctional pyr operon transcriptional regulator/uracil phosphoribosyltransferase PyrR [Burkholderiales bacterium]|nr:bifunctional pyr operon transcriptional regulator/uracil phosphoribosyltransferase PyrR [Burkholderiales bacterium]
MIGAADLPDAEAQYAALEAAVRAAVGPDTALVGIHTGGVWVAERLHARLATRAPLGAIDTHFYRDDVAQRGLKADVRVSALPFEMRDADVLLVDDVLFTGRTIRAALNVLFDWGRPRRVRLAVLADRSARELPVVADFSGGAIAVPAGALAVLSRGDGGRFAWSIEAADGR